MADKRTQRPAGTGDARGPGGRRWGPTQTETSNETRRQTVVGAPSTILHSCRLRRQPRAAGRSAAGTARHAGHGLPAILLLGAVAFVCLPPHTAQADPAELTPSRVGVHPGEDGFDGVIDLPGGGGSGGGDGGGSGEREPTVSQPVIGDHNGAHCVRFRAVPEASVHPIVLGMYERMTKLLLARLPLCPRPGDLAGLTPGQQVTVGASRAYDSVSVPPLEPSVAPGIALTGLPTFLETGPDSAMTTRRTLRLGPATLRLRLTSRIDVDWGDDHTSAHRTVGGPWPDGGITHVYRDRPSGADVTIEVRQTWTGTWRSSSHDPAYDGLQGSLPDLVIRRTLVLPIDEVQAVRQ